MRFSAGLWKPKKIENPEFYEVEGIGLLPATAIGIDVWAMDHSVMFDNILVTNNEAEALELAAKTWRKKRDIENEQYNVEVNQAFERRAELR